MKIAEAEGDAGSTAHAANGVKTPAKAKALKKRKQDSMDEAGAGLEQALENKKKVKTKPKTNPETETAMESDGEDKFGDGDED